jgi:hypothetical protein
MTQSEIKNLAGFFIFFSLIGCCLNFTLYSKQSRPIEKVTD